MFPTKVDSVRKLLSLVLAMALLVLTACGAATPKTVGEAAPLDSIELTPGADDNTAPTVTFDAPLNATAAGAKVLEEGDGAEIKANQNVSYKLAGYNTEDGKEVGNIFASEPQILSLTEEMKNADPEIYNILLGSKVGSWVAYVRPTPATPAPEAEGEGGSSAPAEPAKASEVLVLKVVGAEDIPPTPEPARMLEKAEVDKLEADGALPTVKFSEGKPAITIPEGKEAPEGLAVQVLKQGDGKTLTEESTITADYAGVRWEDGEVFDSSYDRGEAASFSLNEVIPGWTQGLAGQKVGSQVVLSIPSSLAYGDDPATGRPTGPLVFVVDIKSAK